MEFSRLDPADHCLSQSDFHEFWCLILHDCLSIASSNFSEFLICSGTGALAIFLQRSFGVDITTSDFDDTEIEGNIAYNCRANGLPPLPHIRRKFQLLFSSWFYNRLKWHNSQEFNARSFLHAFLSDNTTFWNVLYFYFMFHMLFHYIHGFNMWTWCRNLLDLVQKNTFEWVKTRVQLCYSNTSSTSLYLCWTLDMSSTMIFLLIKCKNI